MGEREKERLRGGPLVCSLFAGLWREGFRRLEGEEVGESSREREIARETASTHHGGQQDFKTHQCLDSALTSKDGEFLTNPEMESRATLFGCQVKMMSQAGGLMTIWIILKFISHSY